MKRDSQASQRALTGLHTLSYAKIKMEANTDFGRPSRELAPQLSLMHVNQGVGGRHETVQNCENE